jgi:hypothetical protein
MRHSVSPLTAEFLPGLDFDPQGGRVPLGDSGPRFGAGLPHLISDRLERDCHAGHLTGSLKSGILEFANGPADLEPIGHFTPDKIRHMDNRNPLFCFPGLGIKSRQAPGPDGLPGLFCCRRSAQIIHESIMQ